MRITDYDQVSTLKDSDVFLIDGEEGTKTITAISAAKALYGKITREEALNKINLITLNDYQYKEPYLNSKVLIFTGTHTSNLQTNYSKVSASKLHLAMADEAGYYSPVIRRYFTEEKNLGNHLTNEQLEAIKNGNFKGLYLGSYWQHSQTKEIFRIIDFDYYKEVFRNGNVFRNHHIVVWCENWNREIIWGENNSKGFFGSNIFAELTKVINKAKEIFTVNGESRVAIWEEEISVNNNTKPRLELKNIQAMIPSMSQLAGFNMTGVTTKNLYMAAHQFALTQTNPFFIHRGISWSEWTRDMDGNNIVVLFYNRCFETVTPSQTGLKIRPYLVIM